jgi:hypothetical protein
MRELREVDQGDLVDEAAADLRELVDRDVVEIGEGEHYVRLPWPFPESDLQGVLLGEGVERDATDGVADA